MREVCPCENSCDCGACCNFIFSFRYEQYFLLLLQSVLPRQLDRHTVGYLTYKDGTHSSINATVVRETEQS